MIIQKQLPDDTGRSQRIRARGIHPDVVASDDVVGATQSRDPDAAPIVARDDISSRRSHSAEEVVG